MDTMDISAYFVTSTEDLPFEEDILRNPFSVKHWLRYIDHKKQQSLPPQTKQSSSSSSSAPLVSTSSAAAVNMVYERALKELPGSYKLWIAYLRLRVKQITGHPMIDPQVSDVNNCFERSLVFMQKMPRIWLEFCQFLLTQNAITKCRRTLDRALQALPITQHNRIWPIYLTLIKTYDIPETAVRVYKRYLKLQPEQAEEFIQYLITADRLDEAAIKLADIVNRDDFLSKAGKSKHQLWTELSELICKNPDKVHSLNVNAIIREGIKRYADEQGILWISLAEYYIRSGLFEKSRDIYEEALLSVTTIKDFSQVFDAYAQSEEQLIKATMDMTNLSDDDDIDLELRIARYEDLIDRRPLLLNSVALRQNPHNVDEWHKRVGLLESKPEQVVEVYTEAVQTVDPKLAVGKVHTLWINFGKFYDQNGQLEDARVIFEKATTAAFTKVDDLAAVWCEWVEMELRHDNWKQALQLMYRATAAPPPSAKKVSYHDHTEPVQNRLFKSLKIWSMYADLEESFGTFTTTKAVYDRIIELRIATPQTIMNYGLFLEELNYYEEAFKAYEKGISLFRWPNVYDIWNTYLTKFLRRYKGSKLERARDLFEQCLANCPEKFAKNFYLLYAKCEEDYGLAKHAMTIYDRAVQAVLPEERYELFSIFVRKAAEMFGVTHTRQIYEKAIDVLNDSQAQDMCLKFAELERKLGEIDRARAIYGHCSQMCDPRTSANFWNVWKEFEVKHGNEDTIREMLRIKRSVAATFNTQVNYMTAQMLAAVNGGGRSNEALEPTSMSQLETDLKLTNEESNLKAPIIGANKSSVLFVKSQTTAKLVPDDSEAAVIALQKTANPDEIDIDEDDDDEEVDDEEDDDGDDESGSRKKEPQKEIQQKMVPKEVFGSLKTADDDDDDDD
ncbi:pre-mRNA-splicing factor syf1 homolog [Oppia nitens]|uniref:pre-mRNA-splicing factor syf1 homolog n=1 Tax=Oppia nitens TaxID=1686743 RepID=UPI0023DBDC22|nr:pre-mRNA-splicing factor syf1 homolog [Oppia nitens]